MRGEAFSELPPSAQHRPSQSPSLVGLLSQGETRRDAQPNCPRLPHPHLPFSVPGRLPQAPPRPSPWMALGSEFSASAQVALLAGYLPRVRDRGADQLCSPQPVPCYSALGQGPGGGGRVAHRAEGRNRLCSAHTLHCLDDTHSSRRREGSEVRGKKPHSFLGAACLLRPSTGRASATLVTTMLLLRAGSLGHKGRAPQRARGTAPRGAPASWTPSDLPPGASWRPAPSLQSGVPPGRRCLGPTGPGQAPQVAAPSPHPLRTTRPVDSSSVPPPQGQAFACLQPTWNTDV